ncbi:TFIIS central domain-containing protein [Plasmodium yoelii yoelii]|uniref:TFIIS central domain-containing protein n=1 Tax=Plasmodium yoelii yoelii TaxID=73239 RepID=A0AAE9WRC8_PLAYO|nr:TFIIS central domain-containing protein [Plasmodium yoelii yoelii]
MDILTKKGNIPEWKLNKFNKFEVNELYSNKSIRFTNNNIHDVFIYDIKTVDINNLINYIILNFLWNITKITFSIKLNNNKNHTCLQKDKQTNICLVCYNCKENNIKNVHYYDIFFSEFYNLTNIYNPNFYIHIECFKNVIYLYISFIYLYNVTKNGNLLNEVIANFLYHAKIKKDEILPAQARGKKDEILPAQARGKKDEILPAQAREKKDEILPAQARGKKDEILPAQARKKKDIIAFAIIGFLIGNKNVENGENKENGKNCENNENGKNVENGSDNNGESKRSGTGPGSGGEKNDENDENEKNDENDKNEQNEQNSSDSEEGEDNPKKQKKRKKMESPNREGNGERNGEANGQDVSPKNKTRKTQNKKKKKKNEEDEEYISNYRNEGDIRNMKRKRKKKQLGDGEYIIDDISEPNEENYENDQDELINENNLSKESDNEYIYDQDLKIYTDEDIVEENEILKTEVYSNDSEFCENDYGSGRKKKKRKIRKSVKKEKKNSIKNENKTIIGTNQIISNGKQMSNQIEEKNNGSSKIEISNIVTDGNGNVKIDNDDKEIYLNDEDVKKYAKVINKIKQSLDNENIKVDTYSISKNIVENVIKKYKNKLDIKMKLFSICSNLLRHDNSELRKKILNGIIHSSDLANMDSSDLAPISLQNKRKEHEKKYFYESIYLRENYINIKNVKNNEEEYYQHNILYDEKLKQDNNKKNDNTSRSRSVSSNRSSHTSNFDKIDITNESYNNDDKKNILIESVNKNNSDGKNELISQQNINNNISNIKEKKKKKSKEEEEDDHNTYIIPSIEKYALENTYENLKSAYKNMPKYASSPILTFLDNSYNRIFLRIYENNSFLMDYENQIIINSEIKIKNKKEENGIKYEEIDKVEGEENWNPPINWPKKKSGKIINTTPCEKTLNENKNCLKLEKRVENNYNDDNVNNNKNSSHDNVNNNKNSSHDNVNNNKNSSHDNANNNKNSSHDNANNNKNSSHDNVNNNKNSSHDNVNNNIKNDLSIEISVHVINKSIQSVKKCISNLKKTLNDYYESECENLSNYLKSECSSVVKTVSNFGEVEFFEEKNNGEKSCSENIDKTNIEVLIQSVINKKNEKKKFTTLDIIDECLSIGDIYNKKNKNKINDVINKNINIVTDQTNLLYSQHSGDINELDFQKCVEDISSSSNIIPTLYKEKNNNNSLNKHEEKYIDMIPDSCNSINYNLSKNKNDLNIEKNTTSILPEYLCTDTSEKAEDNNEPTKKHLNLKESEICESYKITGNYLRNCYYYIYSFICLFIHLFVYSFIYYFFKMYYVIET